MNVVADAIVAICGLIIAIGGAGVYVKKATDAIRRPIDEVRADIKEMKKEQTTNEKYFKNDAARLDEHDEILHELQQDNKIMLRSVMLLLSHAETGNNTGEVSKGRKELEDYLIKR